MIRRIALLAIIAALAIFAAPKILDIPAGIRHVESILFPVLHKDIINRYAGIYKEDPLFVISLIKVESNFFRKAKSARGAMGLMQIMPGTAKEIARELKMQDFDVKSLENPDINIHIGFHYIAKLRKEFGDDITVLGAYNAGGKNVREWLKNSGRKTLAVENIEFNETKKFAQDVLFTYRWLKKIQKARNRLLSYHGSPT